MEITKCSCGHCIMGIASNQKFYFDDGNAWCLFCRSCGDRICADTCDITNYKELTRDAAAMRYIRDELIELQVNSFDEVDDEKWVAIRMKLGTDGNRRICPDATAGTPQDAVFKAMER